MKLKSVLLVMGALAIGLVVMGYWKDAYIWFSAEPYMDLSGRDFSRVNFRKACLIGASLERANLSGANFQYVQLNEAKLAGANFRGANLIGTTLFGADLRGADLSYANMEAIDLREADLSGAIMHGANLTNAWMWGAKGANLEGTYGKPRAESELHPELKKRRFEPSKKPVLEQSPKKRKVDEIEEVLGFWVGEWVVRETRTDRNGQSMEGPPARIVGRWQQKGKVIEEKYFVEKNGRQTQVRVDHHEYDPVQSLYIYRMNPFLFGGGEGVFHSRYDSSSRTFNGELVSPKAPLPNMKLTRTFKQIGRDKFIYRIEVSGGPASGNVVEGEGIRKQ